MKRWLCVLIISLVTITGIAQTSLVDSCINPASLKEIVEFLAADSLRGRLTGSPGEQMAAEYIAAEFQKAGAAPVAGNDGFFMPFVYAWNNKPHKSKNVMAVLPGTTRPDELVIFSAHYDHIGTSRSNPVNVLPERGRPEKKDTVYNGANDNASGVSALITLARYFGKLKNNERTIMLVAFSGEELGLMGSREMVKTIESHHIMAMINMDMLGVAISKRRTNPFITGSEYSNLRQLLNNKLYETNEKEYGKNYFTTDPFPGDNLFGRSDNYLFAQRGVPAHTIMTSSPTYRYYHSLNDESSTLDFDLLAKVIKAITISSSVIIDGSKTPRRIIL